MSNRCRCHGLTVKEINEKFQEESERTNKQLAIGIYITMTISLAVVYGLNHLVL